MNKELLESTLFFNENINDITNYDINVTHDAENFLKNIYEQKSKNPEKIITNSKHYCKYWITNLIAISGSSGLQFLFFGLSRYINIFLQIVLPMITVGIITKTSDIIKEEAMRKYVSGLDNLFKEEIDNVNELLKKCKDENKIRDYKLILTHLEKHHASIKLVLKRI